MWEKMKKEIRHNQFLVSAIFMAGVLVFWVYGCYSKTTSPWNPDQKITRMELETQVATYNLQVEAAVKDLDRQDLFKQELVTVGVAVAEAGGVAPAGVGVGVLVLGLLGVSADNRKKNSIIETLKKSRIGGMNGTDTATS